MLTDDEPLGPDWGGIGDPSAKRPLTAMSDTATLDQVAATLSVKPMPVVVPSLTPSTKLVLAGGAAIVSVAKAFAGDRGLSWTNQVVVVAAMPTFRQLAGLGAELLGARGRTALIRPTGGR